DAGLRVVIRAARPRRGRAPRHAERDGPRPRRPARPRTNGAPGGGGGLEADESLRLVPRPPGLRARAGRPPRRASLAARGSVGSRGADGRPPHARPLRAPRAPPG